MEVVVISPILSWHRIKILHPWGEDEEGAFGTGEEALAFGLAGNWFLLKVNEGEAAFDGEVLNGEFARGDAGRDEDGALLGCVDPGVTIVEPRLCVDVVDLGTRVGRIGKGRVVIREALVEGELLHACLAMAEDLRLQRPAQQEEVAEGGVAHASDGEAQTALHELRHACLDDGAARVVLHVGNHGLQLPFSPKERVVVVIIEERSLSAGVGGVVLRALRAGHAVWVGRRWGLL